MAVRVRLVLRASVVGVFRDLGLRVERLGCKELEKRA